MKDDDDSTYRLEFVSIKQNLPQDIIYACKGSLTQHMQYMCSISKICPPAKAKWISLRAIYYSHSTKLDILLRARSSKPLKLKIDLCAYNVVLAVGNSITFQLFCIYNLIIYKNMFHNRKPGISLNTESLNKYIS